MTNFHIWICVQYFGKST